MGKRGPPKTPTNVLDMRGSPLAAGRKNEPQPRASAARCPSWLKGEAAKLWKKLEPRLRAVNLFTELDEESLAQLCYWWSEARLLDRIVKRKGRTYTTDALHRIRPEYRLLVEASKRFHQLAREFGLTPSGRAGLEVDAPTAPKGGKLVKYTRSS